MLLDSTLFHYHLVTMANAKKEQAEQAFVPGSESFEFEGKKYSVLVHAVHIPGLGERTAAEIAVDEKAQKALIEADVLGTVLEEVL